MAEGNLEETPAYSILCKENIAVIFLFMSIVSYQGLYRMCIWTLVPSIVPNIW